MFALLKSTKIALSAFAVSAGLGLMLPTQAQQPQEQIQLQMAEGTVAVVNDKVITSFDVRQRMRFMLLTSGGRIPKEAYAQVEQKALQDLIEETLKLAEAEKLDFKINDELVEQELTDIAARSRATLPELENDLRNRGVDPDTIRAQIKARLVWQRLVSARYKSRVKVNPREVEDTLNRLREDSSQTRYHLSEICLAADDPSRVNEIMRGAMQIVEQMRRGVPFDALARQFSVCNSSANGGDKGWVHAGELDEEVANIITNMREGSVSRPIERDGVVYLFALRQKRAASQVGEPSFQVVYAGAPTSVGAEYARDRLSKVKNANGCKSNELSQDLGANIGVLPLPQLPLSKFNPAFHTALKATQRGDVTEMIEHEGGYHVFQICDYDEGLGLPSRKRIEDKLFAEQMELISRRYLRDLRRDSAVVIAQQ